MSKAAGISRRTSIAEQALPKVDRMSHVILLREVSVDL